MKKLLSMLLVALMLVGMLPAIGASAETGSATFSFAGGNGTNQDPIPFADEASGISIEFTAGTHSTKPRWDASLVRFYGTASVSNHLTVSAPEGTTITEIAFSMGSYGLTAVSADSGSIDTSTKTWTGSASSVVFTTTAQTRFAGATVTYTVDSGTAECEHTNKIAVGDAVNPSCTTTGMTAGEKCADCNQIITAQEEIPALGHSYVNGVCSVCQAAEPAGFVLTEVHNIKATDTVIITMTNASGTVYALANDKGTGNPPTAVEVEVVDGKIVTEATNVQWNVVYDGGDLTIYPAGTTATWLYCTSSNNGVRVGTNTNKIFTVDASSGYLKHTATSRYLGVYNSQDWRCYTSVNSNITGQTLGFYVMASSSETECTHDNMTLVDEEPADCTHTGFTEAIYCPDCDTYLEGHELIEALGHNYGEWTTTTTPGCETAGEQTQTCGRCGDAQTQAVDPTGHNYVNDVCQNCGDELVNLSGRYVIAAQRSDDSVWFMTGALTTGSTKRYQAVDSGLTAIPSAASGAEGQVFVLERQSDLTYKIYAEGLEGDNYLGWTSGNSGALVSAENAKALTVAESETAGAYNITFTDRILALNSTSGNDYFAFYASGQANDLYLIPICTHSYEASVTPPTFDAEGYTTYTCTGCGDSYVETDEGSKLVAVASIDDSKYESLAAAVNAANVGDTVVLLADTQLTEILVIAEDKDIILDLNGKAITVTKTGERSLYAFENNGKLTLTDSVGSGTITARGNYNYGTMVMEGGTIIACDTNGGYGVWNYGNFTMNGGTFKVTHVGDYADQYGPTGLGNESGATALITGGSFEGSNMRAYIIASDGTMEITPAEGKTVTVNAPRGVAVDSGTTTINGGSFTAVPTTHWAKYYALYASNGTVIINDGVFTAEKYTVNIGGDITISGGTFNAPLGSNEENPTGVIHIVGGQFKDFNPACNTANGQHASFAADGYIAVADENGFYTLIEGSYEQAIPAVPATCTATGLTEGVECSNCGTVLVTQTVTDMIDHSYDAVVTEPTATKEGYTTYTCTECGDSYVGDEVPALGIGELKFASAALALHNNLTMIFYVDSNLFIEDAYTAPYAVFTIGKKTQTVTEYTVVDGKYAFACTNIAPSQMGDMVNAELHATLNGEEQTVSMEYGVANYCYNMLGKTEDAKLRTLLVDLLNYGAAAQTYAWYNDKTLCNADLTEEQKAWGTATEPALTSVLNTKYATVDTAKAKWRAASLVLENNVTMKFRFAAESIEGLSVKIELAGQTYIISEFEADPNNAGQYYVSFSGTVARQMRETVLVTVYEGDTAVSNTLSYSIESYAYAKQNEARLGDLVKAMMKYGDSAAAYLN